MNLTEFLMTVLIWRVVPLTGLLVNKIFALRAMEKPGNTADAGRLALDLERQRRFLEECRAAMAGSLPLRAPPLVKRRDPPHELAVINRLCESNRTVRQNELWFLAEDDSDFSEPREIGREVSGAYSGAKITRKNHPPKPPENKNTGDYVR